MTEALADLDLCAAEPIRIPGGIQPHGALLVFSDPDLLLLQASANAGAILGRGELPRPGMPLGEALATPSLADDLASCTTGTEPYLGSHVTAAGRVQVSAHRTPQGLIVEIEPDLSGAAPASHYEGLRIFLDEIDDKDGVEAIGAVAAAHVRRITGFNRALIYRFDEAWNGTVVAEDNDGVLPSYLDLRFPASDIPAQARELYRLNRLRLIPSSDYVPVPLVPPLSPVDGRPLDLGLAALRSVSPVHLEYMRNMDTAASMSVSIIIDGALWGLISCHNRTPRAVGADRRAACDFLARILAQKIASVERSSLASQRLALKQVETELIAHLTRSPAFEAALAEKPALWLALTNAAGAALVNQEGAVSVGRTPPPERLRRLAIWLRHKGVDTVYSTSSLSAEWSDAADLKDTASGFIAASISQLHPSYLMWFRPEVAQSVKWGGDPRKPATVKDDMRIHPRKSFDTWKETVTGKAEPWRPAEIISAGEFRTAVVSFVLERAEELAGKSEKLQRSNRELEAFSYSISHDLRAPFRHIVGYAQLLAEEEPDIKDLSRHYLGSIRNAALSAGNLVDDLLHFSQLGRATLAKSRIDMQKMAEEIRRSFDPPPCGRRIEWRIGRLPPSYGDAALIRQALYNLADNAVKYSGERDPAIIEITGEEFETATRYAVSDNGAGFDMAYSGKLFQVFQRLHHADEYEGTGIGLALTKRIIERHGGEITAAGERGKGARFEFSLPRPKERD